MGFKRTDIPEDVVQQYLEAGGIEVTEEIKGRASSAPLT